jgi:hypothetical protein
VFSKTSRYQGLPELTWRGPDDREVAYVGRRLVPRVPPPADRWEPVAPDERLDLVAARTLGRPELFWKLCDANGVLDPFDPFDRAGAAEAGVRRLRVPEE